VAQHGAEPASEDCSEVAALAGQRCAADGVDAAVDPTQAATLRAQLHRARLEPEVAQLRQREHSPLPGGELGEGPIDACAVFAKHVFA
jgi:hypothetical protein